MKMYCDCDSHPEPLDIEWRNWVIRNWEKSDGAVEVFVCPECGAHQVTVLRNGKRETVKTGGPELVSFHNKLLIQDGALAVWQCEVLDDFSY